MLFLFGRALATGNSTGGRSLRGFLFDFPLSQKPMLDVPPFRAPLALPDGIGSQPDRVLRILGHDDLHFIQGHFIQGMTRGTA